MTEKISFGISQKLLIMLLLVALLPLLTLWFASYRSTTALTQTKVESELSAANNELITYVNGWVEMNERMLRQNADLVSVRSMRGAEQTPVLKSMARYYDWAYLVFTVDPQGNNVSRSDGKPLLYYGDREYFQQVLRGNQFGKQILIGKTSGKPAMVLSTAITDSSGSIKGVLAQAMTLTDLSNRIVSKRIGATGFSFLVDENNEVIAHPNDSLISSRTDLSQHQAIVALAQGQSSATFKDHTGAEYIAVTAKTSQGWTMVTQQHRSEAYQLISSENRKAIYLLVATLIIVIAISWFVSRWLTAPIRELTEIADKYSQGELDLNLSSLERRDEIGQLSQAIDRLGTSIRLALERLKK